MAKLFITGDTHGDIDFHKLNTRHFPMQSKLTKEDIVVVLGDWGAIWYGNEKDRYLLNWWNNKPWTTFVVLGNHENYEAINQLPIARKFGSSVRKAGRSIFIAETGNVYTFCNKKCLVLNGANSHDKIFRKEGVSWWSQEEITQDDANKALISLAGAGDDIDYFFTHTGGGVATASCGYKSDSSDRWVDYVMNHLPGDGNWKHFCGHLHVDKCVNDKTKILYQDIILLHDTDCDIDDGACVSLYDGFRING